ncbi:MAG: hypothetical protein WCE48_09430 [Steroidobacteraceae bacterium]|jgi:hypothetical protein
MAKRRSRAPRPWTASDIKKLKALAKAKLSATKAAKKLGRSRGAVAQKAMLLRIRFQSINQTRWQKRR